MPDEIMSGADVQEVAAPAGETTADTGAQGGEGQAKLRATSPGRTKPMPSMRRRGDVPSGKRKKRLRGSVPTMRGVKMS